ACVTARDDGSVQLELELEIEAEVAPAGEVRQRRRLLLGRRHAVLVEQGERRDPARDRRLEGLSEEGAEWHVFPRLNVAGAPVVHEHDSEDVLGEALCLYRLAQSVRDTQDETKIAVSV